jgi:hypothetical protein
MKDAPGIVLSADELAELTGFVRPNKQLEELHRQGFVRARHVNGQVIVERAHYEAVCAGIYGLGPLVPKAEPEPELRLEFNPRRPRQHRRRP